MNANFTTSPTSRQPSRQNGIPDSSGSISDTSAGDPSPVTQAGSNGHEQKASPPKNPFARNGDQAKRFLHSNDLLAHAEQLAGIGSWELDCETMTIGWSAQFYRMLGVEPNNRPLDHDTAIEFIHPDDRERAIRDLEDLRTQGRALDHDLRFITTTGEVRTFHSRAVRMADESGRIVRIRGICQDITERKAQEEKLQESEALLTQAEEIANLGTWECDLKASKLTLSKNLRRLYGMESGTEWTREDYWQRIHPKDIPQARQIVEGAMAACQPFEYIVRYLPPEGGIRVHLAKGIPIRGPDGTVIRSIGFVQDITDQKRVEEELHQLTQQLLRIRDDDRRTMARELHESAGQSLAALKMTLGRLRDFIPQNADQAKEFLQASVELAEDAIREVRTISYVMHPPLLDEAGLGPALRWYAKGFAQRSGIELRTEIPDVVGRQHQEVETTIFRIVQEALTNVHRYSGSRTAAIRVAEEGGYIRAEVADEGCGLPLPASARRRTPAGVGIAAMRERVEKLNGVFEIESAPGRGTIIRAMLPVPLRMAGKSDEHSEDSRFTERQRRQVKQANS